MNYVVHIKENHKKKFLRQDPLFKRKSVINYLKALPQGFTGTF